MTKKPEPNDVDIVMLMDHSVAQSMFGSSVFRVRKLAALGGEDDFIAGWQIKRDGTPRGIVEVIA